MISRETIRKIFDAAEITDVIGEFISLKKSGSNYKALSPFTDEKTPSFFVSPEKQIFKCFSSGKGGNAVTFLMEHEKMNYPEALKYLAEKYQIDIEEDENKEADVSASIRETLFRLNKFAADFYKRTLLETNEGKSIGLSYLHERAINEESIEKFMLGFAPVDWDALIKNAEKSGYKSEYLIKSGLAIEKNGKTYDRFRDRVIFPIVNHSGRIVGFGGRTLRSDTKQPKYINSPETEIYDKSNVLYGLNIAKKAIANHDMCYLVEGYTDVISMMQNGIENVVSTSGTALTKQQINLIKRYTKNITIIFDADRAGIKASFRGLDLILEHGLNPKVVQLPDNEDPDSFARKYRATEISDYLEKNAKDFIHLKIDNLKDEAATDPVKRAGMIREIVSTLSVIPDMITRSVYVKECSRMTEIPEQILLNEIKKIRLNKLNKEILKTDTPDIEESREVKTPDKVQRTNTKETEIIRILLNYGSETLQIIEEDEKQQKAEKNMPVAFYIVKELQKENMSFENPYLQVIFNEYSDFTEKNETIPERYFFHYPDENVARIAVDLTTFPYSVSKNWEKHMIEVKEEKSLLDKVAPETIYTIMLEIIYKMRKELQEKLKDITTKDDAELFENETLQQIKNLDEAKEFFGHAKLGRIILK